MQDTEIRNARIVDTMLGLEDHGIYTFYLTLEFQGHSQGYGGYYLLAEDIDTIPRLLKAVGVRQWEALKGLYVRVKRDGYDIHAIGHIVEDTWFTLRLTDEERKLREAGRKLVKQTEAFAREHPEFIEQLKQAEEDMIASAAKALVGKRVRINSGHANGEYGTITDYKEFPTGIVYGIRFDHPVYMSASAAGISELRSIRSGFDVVDEEDMTTFDPETLIGKRVRINSGDAIGEFGTITGYTEFPSDNQPILYDIRFDHPVYMSAIGSSSGGLRIVRSRFDVVAGQKDDF